MRIMAEHRLVPTHVRHLLLDAFVLLVLRIDRVQADLLVVWLLHHELFLAFILVGDGGLGVGRVAPQRLHDRPFEAARAERNEHAH